MSRMAFIFPIRISVPPSAVPQGEVEWFEPTRPHRRRILVWVLQNRDDIVHRAGINNDTRDER